MSVLKIERLGGLGAFGSNPNLKSEGQLAFDDLPPDDQATVEKLFKGGSKRPAKNTADMFKYRITRLKEGSSESVEVPESLVPEALKSTVKDTFR